MKLGIFLLFAIVGLQVHAQRSFTDLDNNKVIYPSPTAASLGKYGEYPVNLYNGLVSIGQDIVTITSGSLKLDVSLSYHAGGNRPSDIPGWVGLGFSLNAGGVITRTIRDKADDWTGGFYMSNDSGKELWDSLPNSEFLEGYFSGTVDPRSDLYQFNFCGHTGEFIFDWDRNIHFKKQVPFKIQEMPGPGGFGGFIVTTDDGVVYSFTQAERGNLGSSLIDAPATAWYLSKIKNLSGDSIVLKYTEPLSEYRYKSYSTRKEVTGGLTDGTLVTGPTINVSSSTDEVIYLDEIDFKGGRLTFGKTIRHDPKYIPTGISAATAEEKKLDSIVLRDDGDEVVKTWKFEYYDDSTQRLKLKNLVLRGSNQATEQKYSFEYNDLKLPLPYPGPGNHDPYLTNDVDYWGFYNAAANGENRIPKQYVPEFEQYTGSANRSISSSFVQAEILQKIVYPTGGFTKFEYESNDYGSQGDSYAADQNPMYEAAFPPESYGFNYSRDEGGFDVDPDTVYFTLSQPTHVNIRYGCSADGPQHEWGEPGVSYEYDLQMSAGTHNLAAVLNTSALVSSSSADITHAFAFVTVYKLDSVVLLYSKKGPGLRIRSIETNDGITASKKSFEYKMGVSQNNLWSSGVLSVFPAFYASLHDLASNAYGFMATSDPINDVGEGSPIGYSRVVERFQDSSYIVHYFTTYSDYPDDFVTFTNGFSNYKLAHMSSKDYMRGLETNTSYYSPSGTLKKEVINEYTELPSSQEDIQSIELKPTVGIEDGGSSVVNYLNGTLTSISHVHSSFLYNSGKTELTYNDDGVSYISAETNTAYDNIRHLQPTRIENINSDGSSITQFTTYADDFAPGVPFIDYLQTNHLTAFPVEHVVYEFKNGDYRVLSGNLIKYKTFGAGLPDTLFKLEIPAPILLSGFKFSCREMGIIPYSPDSTQFTPDGRYKWLKVYDQYDSVGNILQTTGRGGTKTSYLWGYNKKYPVASVLGSDYSTVSSYITPSVLNSPSSDAALRANLNNLRTISGTLSTTFTFKPLIGITSETNAAGQTQFYEYDSFGRLNLIRDQDSNIVKKYCYNYAGQPEQCFIYQNAAFSSYYYSQSCSGGQEPEAYAVTVPAGMFISYSSQTAADSMANAYAQQQANLHGTCATSNIDVVCTSDVGSSFTVQLHNNSTGVDYYVSLSGHSETDQAVPPGSYNITMIPGSPSGYFNYDVGCGYSDAGNVVYFYSVDLNSSCKNIYIY